MRVVRMFAALVTATGLALVGGCGPGGSPAALPSSAAQPASADPRTQLVAGVKALNSATFRSTESGVLGSVATRSEGAADPGRRAARLTQTSTVAGSTDKTDVVVLGTDVYLRFGTPAVPGLAAGKWAHVDGRRVTSLRSLGVGTADDLSGKLALAEALTSIERTGPRELRGTFDLSKGGARAELVNVLGDGIRNVPWRARFDAHDRLVWLSVSVPATGVVSAYTTETTYSGFGEPVTVDRPPARDTVEAPDSLYTLFGR